MKSTVYMFLMMLIFINATKAADPGTSPAAVSTVAGDVTIQAGKQDTPELTDLIEKNPAANINDKKRGQNFFSKLLIGADAGLTALTLWNYIDYSISATGYNSSYVDLNGTTYDNYILLLDKYNTAREKERTFLLYSGLAAAAIVYTFLDANFFHFIINTDVSVNVRNNGIMIAALGRF